MTTNELPARSQPGGLPAESDAGIEEIATRPPSIRQAAIAGGRWRLIENIALQGITALTTPVLARILTPEHFSLIAATFVVLGLFQMVSSVGLSPALVQQDKVSDRVLSTSFWAATGLGLLGGAAFTALAAPAAALFGKPEAAPYLAVAALTVPLGLLASPAHALLFREFRFRTLAVASTVSTLAYGILAVSLAYFADLGVWAIILARLLQTAIETGITYLGAHWRPRMEFDVAAFRRQMRFNLGFWSSGVNAYMVKNADYWAVGRMAGDELLGLYYVAYVLPNLIRQRMTWAVQNLLFSAFSRMQAETERLRRVYLEVLRLVGFVVFPSLVGVALASRPLVRIFFGSAWEPAARPMAILALAAALSAVPPLASAVLLARGKPLWNLVANATQLAALLPGAVLAVRVGTLEAMAWAVFASTVVRLACSSLIVRRELELPVVESVRALRPLFLPILGMAGVVIATRAAVPSMPDILLLPLLVAVGAASYFGLGLALSTNSFLSLIRQVREGLFSRNRTKRRGPLAEPRPRSSQAPNAADGATPRG